MTETESTTTTEPPACERCGTRTFPSRRKMLRAPHRGCQGRPAGGLRPHLEVPALRARGAAGLIELGVYTFAERTPDPATGRTIGAGERLRDLMDEIALADELGLDVFGVGEHHRPEYAVSAPAVVLAAAAARTRRIRLTSAVTVLSSDDPVRVFQDFATLDLLSEGRAEIMAGRGSFIESFPLFGYDLAHYDELFAEKLELLLALRDSERITWHGRHHPDIDDRGVYPRPAQDPLPVWIAVGGTPASVVRAGALGLPLAIAIIGGSPARFRPLADLHREAAREAGHARRHPDRDQHPRLRRRHLRARGGRVLPALRARR